MKNIRQYIKSRLPLLLLALCIMSCAVVSMVYSKYVTNKDGNSNVNITAEGKLTVTVSDPVNGAYTVTNSSDSNMSAFVRLTVVVNLLDNRGRLWATPTVEGQHYTVTANNCKPLSDGYYYYNGTLAPGNTFTVTVNEGTVPSNLTLQVQVLAEAIQCVPADVAEDAWSATFANNAWTKQADPTE